MRAYYGYTYYRPRHKRYSYMTGNDIEYTYGTSGNETGRFLFWTEDCYGCEHLLCQSNVVSNRMHAAVDEKHSSYYVYDHSGGSCASREQSQACLSYAEMEQRRRSQRRLKLTGTNDLLDVNADYMYTASVLKEPTIYPSAYMVMSNRGYTKHYYAGAERVAARIGGGGLYAIDQEHGLSDKSGSVFQQSLEQINERILENNDIEFIANGLSSNDKLTIDMNEVPERLQAKLITDYDEFRHMIDDAQSIHHNEPDVYFYHSDHLGSASWITDNGDLAVQHLQYLPYGERYVDQRAAGTTYRERFRFTGKERDEETGYGYFGTRYMDHELMTMWLSVDPMADKYPSISPYAYCAWNPVKLVDPDGREIGDFYDEFGNYLGSDGVNDRKVYQTTREAWNRHISGDPSGSQPIVAGLGNNEYDNLKQDKATDCLGKMNEYGYIQLTKMGNPNIQNHPNEDWYSYTNKDGVVMPKDQYGDDWVTPATGAAFNYAVKSSGVTVVVNDVSAYDGVTNLGHKTHRNGTAIDFRYVTADGKGCSDYKSAPVALNNLFLQYIHNAGFSRSISGGLLNTTMYDPKIHSDHLHINR